MLVGEFFWSDKIFDEKSFGLEKKIWSEKNLVVKNFWLENFVFHCQKKVLVGKFVGWKTLLVGNFFGWKTFLCGKAEKLR